ncbi:MAG TPA: branched-chain amino acid ABC transporter substrate-binding protein, partial [Acidimicrobiales bacterium]|nr:branched-chain amino acid ABC transporter substrate-binding protein [Acidimicrobiales bacterium]
SALGLLQNNAVQVAIAFANQGKTFGKLPFKLKYTQADDQGSGTNSPAAANQLITNGNVVAVVGPAFSGATKAAEPLFNAAHMATVSPSATNPLLAQEGWNNFFRVVADDNVQGPSDADYIAMGLKAKNAYVVNDATAYGSGVAGAVAGRLAHDGVKVTADTVDGTTQCSDGTGDVTEYPPEAAKIAAANPNVVFYGGYYCDFALLAKALRSAGYKGQLFSDDGSEDPHFILDAGTSVANGTEISSPGAAVGTTKLDKEFASAFKAKAGFKVGEYSPESFDCTNVIIDAMKTLWAAKKPITRANIASELHKISYQGITKLVKFKTNGNIYGGTIYVYKVVNGSLSLLGTTKALAAK